MKPDTSPSPAPPHDPGASATHPGNCASPFSYRGRGKIARLPKNLRDQVNQWLLDGLPYSDIIQRLGPHGADLKPDNLSQWKKRGHPDWLLQQAWLDQTRARQEPAADLSTDFDATQVNHAALQLASLHIFEALRDLEPALQPPAIPTTAPDPDQPSHASPPSTASAPPDATAIPNQNSEIESPKPSRRSLLDFKLGGDSAAFVRLINALARASRETMLVQKYRDACAQARAALQPMKDPNRKLSDAERHAIVHHVDQILGLDQVPARDPGAAPDPALGIITLHPTPSNH